MSTPPNLPNWHPDVAKRSLAAKPWINNAIFTNISSQSNYPLLEVNIVILTIKLATLHFVFVPFLVPLSFDVR